MHPQSEALRALAEKWGSAPLEERTDFSSYITELCKALGVAPPTAFGSDYAFAHPVTATDRRTGAPTTHYIDLYRQGHFVLLARHVGAGEDANQVLAPAYGQAKRYAGQVAHGPPPYVMVMDLGRRLLYWDRWKGEYAGFNDGDSIDLRPLWRNGGSIDLLRALWDDPQSLNPSAALERLLPQIEIVYGPEGREIVLADAVIAPVVEALRETGTRFTFHDPLYPSFSDPGAYVAYTPRTGGWGMTLGNHGWSGGEYAVESAVICAQLRNLVARGLLRSIVLVDRPAGPPKDPGNHRDMNQVLLDIHDPGTSSGR